MSTLRNSKSKFGLITALSALLLSAPALAVPLFGETAGTIKDGVLTLYRDHEDPKKVYFFPNSTKFSTDDSGVPMFNYVYWGLSGNSASAGAYLTMATHLASDDAQRTALNNFIASHPDVEVAVLPIKSSTIGLQTTVPGAQPLTSLFSEFNFAHVGGRAEDEIGVNAVLTPVGARAFKALLSKDMGGGKIKFDYCYKAQGFGPNMNASIVVDMRRAYDYFEASYSAGWLWFSTDIKTVVEKLADERSIQITMNGGDAKQWEVLEKVATSITERLFKPELSAAPASIASTNRFYRFAAGSVKKEELKKETWTWVRRDLEEREFCTAVVVKDLQNHIDKLVTSAD